MRKLILKRQKRRVGRVIYIFAALAVVAGLLVLSQKSHIPETAQAAELLKINKTTVWAVSNEYMIFSSPRALDINQDGILDIIVGHGIETFDEEKKKGVGYVAAYDGKTGRQLWRLDTHDEIFGSAALMDINLDGIQDVVIGGRRAALYAIDSVTGRQRWSFETKEPGWFNFHNAQPIADVDGDGVQEIVISNGGDDLKGPFEPRKPGHLVVLSGSSGEVLVRAVMPESAETYMSAYVYQPSSDAKQVVLFGSGGETQGGSLWMESLDNLLYGDIAHAKQLVANSTFKGLIGPPALVDLTQDGIYDIVVATFDGRLVAVDGSSFQQLWNYTSFLGESYLTPAIGYFNEDDVPDVFMSFAVGMFPEYRGSVHVLVDGKTGEELWRREDDKVGHLSSPLAVDITGDGLDEVFFTVLKSGPETGLVFDRNESELFILEPRTFALIRLTEIPGVMLSTPWLGDIDNDGLLDIVFGYNNLGFDATSHTLQRIEFDAETPERISWAAYQGTDYDGIFR